MDNPPVPCAVTQLNLLLGVDIWSVPSFRANVQIDFDEYGGLMGAKLLTPTRELGLRYGDGTVRVLRDADLALMDTESQPVQRWVTEWVTEWVPVP